MPQAAGAMARAACRLATMFAGPSRAHLCGPILEEMQERRHRGPQPWEERTMAEPSLADRKCIPCDEGGKPLKGATLEALAHQVPE